MKKLLKSKKALSPVVAAIILIAVTVAVSIAVAVWMGSLSFNFMQTEQLQITKVEFVSGSTVNVTVMNTGTSDVIISDATVTGFGVTDASVSSTTIGEGTAPTLTLTTNAPWTPGNLYNIELISSKGTKFTYTETA